MLAYEEILDFITSQPSLEAIVAFELSEKSRQRVQYLDLAKARGSITHGESDELEEFNKAIHFMEMVKIRARRRLGME